MRDYVKLVDPKYKDFAIEHLDKNSLNDEEKDVDFHSGEI